MDKSTDEFPKESRKRCPNGTNMKIRQQKPWCVAKQNITPPKKRVKPPARPATLPITPPDGLPAGTKLKSETRKRCIKKHHTIIHDGKEWCVPVEDTSNTNQDIPIPSHFPAGTILKSSTKKRCNKGTRLKKYDGKEWCVPVSKPEALPVHSISTESIQNSPTESSDESLLPEPVSMPQSSPNESSMTFSSMSSESPLTSARELEPESFSDSSDSAKSVPGSPTDPTSYIYPDLDDPQFNRRIYERAEFRNTKTVPVLAPVKEMSDAMCGQPFTLAPHQIFIRNFLSPQSPYTSALLYHGLGSGKTCSSIGIAEEMRKMNARMGLDHKHTYIIAMPNVQDNFKRQLFDETELVRVGGKESLNKNIRWKINSCVGNNILDNINHNGTRKQIIQRAKLFIRKHYKFIGYGALVNLIQSEIQKVRARNMHESELKIRKRVLNRLFSGHFLIMDEIQNIKNAENLVMDELDQVPGTSPNAEIADDDKFSAVFYQMVRHVSNMRFVFLSATPMYNQASEIIWITNMMNINDGRPAITVEQVFDAKGNFVQADPDQPGSISGQDLLRQKLTGYVSYVRGESPYTFPFRIYPTEFDPSRVITQMEYPSHQINGLNLNAFAGTTFIEQTTIQHLPVYVSDMSLVQSYFYLKYVRRLIRDTQIENYAISVEMMKIMAANKLLNIIYPTADTEDIIKQKLTPSMPNVIENVITREAIDKDYRYVDETTNGFRNHLFSLSNIGAYSTKLKTIGECIEQSEGIVVIFSQYIDAGIIPASLMLEEMGYTRKVGNNVANLFHRPPAPPNNKSYTLITGSNILSPNNSAEVNLLTSADNTNGQNIKVALISMAGAEGIDFRNVRQIHILDAWYNVGRIEQIIGRGVRFRSHCRLPFEKRNVQIYLHGSKLNPRFGNIEPVDLYMYRKAEIKAIQIGKVTRLLKETAVDCLLSESQSLLTQEELSKIEQNREVECVLSNQQRIRFAPGDKPFTNICDWMDTCYYKCRVGGTSTTSKVVDRSYPLRYDTYSTHHISSYVDAIHTRIMDLFRNARIYDRDELIQHIQYTHEYPIDAVYMALNDFIERPDQYPLIHDNVVGRLRRSSSQYSFQPRTITDPYSDLTDTALYREHPLKIPAIIENVDATTHNLAESATKNITDLKTDIARQLRLLETRNGIEAKQTSLWLFHMIEIFRNNKIFKSPLTNQPFSESHILVHHQLDSMPSSARLTLLLDSLQRKLPSSDADTDNAIINKYIDDYFERSKFMYQSRPIYPIQQTIEDGVGAKQYSTKILYYTFSGDNTRVIRVPENKVEDITQAWAGTIPDVSFFSVVGFYTAITDQTAKFKIMDLESQPTGRIRGVVCGTDRKNPPRKIIDTILAKYPDIFSNALTDSTKKINNSHLCVFVEICFRRLALDPNVSTQHCLSPEELFIYSPSRP